MPLYEYHCEQCAHDFEQIVSSSSCAAAVVCPKCNSTAVHKQLSVFAVGAAAAPAPRAPKCGSCANAGSCPYLND